MAVGAVGVVPGTSVRVGVPVRVGNNVTVGVGVRDGGIVHVGVGVHVGVAVGAETNVDVGSADGVRVGVTVGGAVAGIVGVGGGAAVCEGASVGSGVRDRVGVLVAGRVGVALRVAVRVGVGVAITPMRTTISLRLPMLPAISATWTATRVSPGGNALLALTSRQYCTTEAPTVTKLWVPKRSMVQAAAGLPAGINPQPRSLKAAATSERGVKSRRAKPGTPPCVQTAGSPSPKSRVA